MKDFIGNTVEVGDFIFYSTTGRYPESRVAVVTRFTKKSMFAKPVMINRSGGLPDKEVVVRNDFIKVTDTGAVLARYVADK